MEVKQGAEKLSFAQVAQKGPDARRRAGYPSAGWVQVRGVLSPYVAAPRERANPPEADRWAFFSSLRGGPPAPEGAHREEPLPALVVRRRQFPLPALAAEPRRH